MNTLKKLIKISIRRQFLLMRVKKNKQKKQKKQTEELWSKIRDLDRSINKSLDDYDEKQMKNKFLA